MPVLSLAQKNVLSLCAASKTFNLAGLEQAAMLVPDEAVRAKINTEMERAGVRSGNLFALEGTRAAYEYGDAWLDGLMRYLDGNRKHLTALVKQELPQAVLTPMEATYLGWLDLRAYGMNCEELMARTLKHGVQFTEGTFFGEGGEGFLRVNIGCPRRNITEGIRPGCTLVVNSPVPVYEDVFGKVCYIDADKLTHEILGEVPPNVAMLGALAKATGCVSIDSLIQAVKLKIPGKAGENNAKACAAAYENA